MALIGKIRKNSWLLVVMLALGLGGFIIMDVSSAGGMGGGNNSFSVGEVNGEEIDWIEFQSAEEALYQNSSVDVYNRREYLWDYFVDKTIVEEEAQAIGLTVGEDEMEELQFGVNISPVVQRNFTDPTTGQLNRQSLNEFRQAAQAGTLAPQFQRVWDYQKTEIEKDRKQAKLVQAVRKGVFTPTWMAEDIQNEVGSSIDFKYVLVPYDEVDDSEIEVTEEDYKAYIKENKRLFEVDEETRDAQYVVFDVLPTPEDTTLLLEKMDRLAVEFRETEEDSLFAVNNLGTYSAAYVKKANMPPALADTAFKMQPGEIFGPYIDGGNYNVAKVLGKQVVPDSVKSRHVLIRIESNEEIQRGVALADSLHKVLNDSLSKFEDLARQFSGDPGSAAQGGDLGYVALNQFVRPMNDLLFYAEVKEDSVYRVNTQFGIHLVQVQDRLYETNEEGVRFALIREPIIPSEETQDALYDDVLEFAGLNRTLETLKETVEADPDLVLEEAPALTENDYSVADLGEGNSSRDVVRWLFESDTKVGEVAPQVFVYEDPVNYFNAKYVVVGLEEIRKPGLPEPSMVMDRIEADVKNNKKAQVLKDQINASTLGELAAQFNTSIDSVENVNFGTQFMKGIGEEPDVLGRATKMQIGDISEPIAGNNGVYMIEITKYVPASAAQNMPRLRQQGSFQVANAAEFRLIESLREEAKIKDMRSQFY